MIYFCQVFYIDTESRSGLHSTWTGLSWGRPFWDRKQLSQAMEKLKVRITHKLHAEVLGFGNLPRNALKSLGFGER